MNLHLAPIQGITTADYRKLYNEIFGGIDVYYSPFIATTGKQKLNESIFKDISPEINKEYKLVPQLLGNNGSDFNYYANMIKSLGYKEINWNIGCPYPTVTKKKKGSGILEHPDLVKAFLDEVSKDLDYKLSIKMRLGMNDFKEGIEVIKIINDYPIDSIILHGRIGKQKYEGTVNLDSFKLLMNASKIPMIYNGDIFTTDDFDKIRMTFPKIDTFMLARGVLRDPFLASEIKGRIFENKIDKIIEFHKRYFEVQEEKLSGDKHLLDKMKGFWTYLAYNQDSDGKYMKKLRKCKTKDQYISLVDSFLGSMKEWK